jgi:LPXTG-site transpeptidase (sortase) family protein
MNKNKKIFSIALLTIISIAVMIFVLLHGFFYAFSDQISIPSSFQKSLMQEATKDFRLYPTQLRIPSINIDAQVQDVGITKNGNMATPNNFTDVGWFKYGALPGTIGSAVIAGHVDDGFALPAVFSNLNDIKKGDDIYVDTVGGTTIRFVVTDIKTYDYTAPTEEIFNQTNGSFLKLITCAGVWVDKYKTHNKRLVVTAIKSN